MGKQNLRRGSAGLAADASCPRRPAAWFSVAALPDYLADWFSVAALPDYLAD